MLFQSRLVSIKIPSVSSPRQNRVNTSREKERGCIDASTHLCVVKFKAGEFEVLEHLDVCVPHQEVTVLLGAALLEGPVLTALDTPAFHHPRIQMHTLKDAPP